MSKKIISTLAALSIVLLSQNAFSMGDYKTSKPQAYVTTTSELHPLEIAGLEKFEDDKSAQYIEARNNFIAGLSQAQKASLGALSAEYDAQYRKLDRGLAFAETELSHRNYLSYDPEARFLTTTNFENHNEIKKLNAKIDSYNQEIEVLASNFKKELQDNYQLSARR